MSFPADVEAPMTERLPPISLLFLLLGTLRQLIIPALASAVAAPGLFAIWMTVLLVPAVLSALVRLWTFSYELHADELVIRQGLLTRTERNIPLARIQNLDLVENPLHRAFGVAEVRLETASGGKPEAVIKVLSHEQIERLRRQIDGSELSESEQAEGEERPVLVETTLGDLTALGLLSNRGMLVVAAAAGLLQQTGYWENPERYEWLEQWLPSAFESFDPGSFSLPHLLILAALAILAFLVATRLLSVAWMIVALYGFRLERRGEDFSSSYGLLTRVTATLPRRRLQLISTHRPWLGRPWHYASMKVETAGGGASDDQQGPGAARLWLAPLVTEEQEAPLVREAMRCVDPESVEWRALAPAAPRRLARRNAVMIFALALFVFFVGGAFWGLLVLPLMVPAAWIGHRHARRCAWGFATSEKSAHGDAFDDEAKGGDLEKSAIFFRSGAFDQRESLVPLRKIQCVGLKQTPFDRRWRMATVRVDTAGASAGGHRVEIPYLDVELAHQLAAELSEDAAETTFHW